MTKLKNLVYCPITNCYLKTNEILAMFSFYHSKDKKTIKITYSKNLFHGIKAEAIIKSIDYGTIDFKPKRLFYPMFDFFVNNYLMFL